MKVHAEGTYNSRMTRCRTWFAAFAVRNCKVLVFRIMVLSAEQKDMVEKLLQAAKAGQLVSSMQQVYSYLEMQGLAWRLTIPPDQVGIHRLNRDGLGCSVTSMQELIADIASVGFTHARTVPICVDADDLEFNRSLSS